MSEMIGFMECTDLPVSVHSPRPKMVHVTDCRFRNEYDMLRNLASKGRRVRILQVRRTVATSSSCGTAHPSNTFDAGMVANCIVPNHGTLEELEVCMKQVLEDLGSDA